MSRGVDSDRTLYCREEQRVDGCPDPFGWRTNFSSVPLKMKKRVAIALLLSMFSLLISWTGLFNYYANTRSKVPDPVSGRVYLINSHGAIAYLTRDENLLLNSLSVPKSVTYVLGSE